MRRLIAAATGLVATVGTIGVVAPPAQAAEGHNFNLPYGATYWKGTVSFSNRSATATGPIRSVAGSGCRYAEVVAYSGSTPYEITWQVNPVCNGESTTISVSATADVPGGVTRLDVRLYTRASRYDAASDVLVRSDKVYR